jgi:predicted SAM-dependent methyltransferase
MLSRRAKATFYLCAAPLMTINGQIYRWFRAPRTGNVKVHLGPGQKNYLPGWVNVDANMFTGKCDVWADLRNPLPFPSGSVAAFYSHHVIEHLPDVRKHLAEIYRCLQPGGVYRVAGPNGDAAMAKYVAGDSSWFGDFPDKRRSIGGKLENFVFVRQEHLTILTFSFLEELLQDAGFIDITLRLPVRETGYPELFADCLAKEDENDFDSPHTLVVEAVKPR